MAKHTKQSLIVFGFFTGVFLPVRMLFYTFISPQWFGSFGLLSGIMLTTIYLCKKKKLGKLGDMIYDEVITRAKGKTGFAIICVDLILIYIFGLGIYGMNNYDHEIKAELNEKLKAANINSIEDVIEKTKPLTLNDLIIELPILFTPNDKTFLATSITNDLTNGWALHFITVFFIELIESLAVVLYFRFIEKPTITSIT